MHVGFVILSLLLINDVCHNDTIVAESSMGMQFISTKILHAKYSTDAICVVIPALLLIVVTVMIIQHHFTLTVLRQCDHFLSDIFCYIAVLGWMVVVLFDSQPMSGHPHQGHIHITGVVLLTIGDAMLHAFTIVSSQQNSTDEIEHFYSISELVYLLFLIAFMFLFTIHHPGAIPVEYGVLVCFFILSGINLFILSIAIDNTDYATETKHIQLNAFKYVFTLTGPIVIFFLITFGFIVELAKNYNYDITT